MIEGTGIITRIDRYTLSVDGKHIPANEDQEHRIRALTPQARHRFLVVLGQLATPVGDVGADRDSDDLEAADSGAEPTSADLFPETFRNHSK